MRDSLEGGTFRLRIQLLSAACWFFAAFGVAVAVGGRSPLFAAWSEAAAQALLGRAELGAELIGFAAFTDGMLGGSIAGKWIAALWLVKVPLRRKERWAWGALVAGLLLWFVLDSAISIALGAAFHVWMINLAPLVIVGALLASLRRRIGSKSTSSPAAGPWRALWIGMAVFVALGVIVAVAIRSPIFDLYNEALRQAFFAGHETLPAAAVAYQRFVYGLIGATFAAHFVMLAWAARRAAGEAWVLRAIATSVVGWFVIDTTACLVHGALFNVLMVNLPALLAVLVLWGRARRTTP